MPTILPPVIAIHGLRRSGKGTTADYLVSHYGYEVVKHAGALKAMTSVLLRHCGYSDATIHRCIESDLKEVALPALGGKTTRYVMQTLGSEWRDLIDRSMWANIASLQMESVLERGGRVVNDDLRFPHEMEPLRALGAEFWLVTSDQAANRTGALSEVDAALAGGKDHFDLSHAVIADMARSLLRSLHMPPDVIERSVHSDLRGTPIPLLNGMSALFVMDSLANEWRAMMEKPIDSLASTTNGHSSEIGLPADWFSGHLRNDGDFGELYAQIEDALIRDLGHVHETV